MANMTSHLMEDNGCKYNGEEEEQEEGQESRGNTKEVALKEAWQPSFFYKMDKELHHFVGQDILIEEAMDSFAASTWPAVTALCHYLERHCKDLDLVDKAVLEIGSGTGLVSIVAALLGAWVTATDLPDALSNLRQNLSKNTRGKCRHTPQAAALSWSLDLGRTYPTSVYHYDYVLAADVVYQYDFPGKLLATMKHFCQPGTEMLWANKVRSVTDVEFEEKFKATFNTKVVFEDGDVRILMATHKEGEDQDILECELQMQDEMEKLGGKDVGSEKEVMLRDGRDSKDVYREGEDHAEVRESGDGDLNEAPADTPAPDPKEDTTDEDVDDETSEEGESHEPTEEAAVSPDKDSDTTEKQSQVKTFAWSASVISSFGKDTYHYAGTDIHIYECIDFDESPDAYGAVMWPGALALCSFLENNKDMVNLEDKAVLELGSGTGLVAIVASLLGGKVTATDLPNFLGNLKANVMRNTRGRCRHVPQICPLTWSFDVGHIYPSHLYRFDFVLAADVVYHHNYLDELLATMSHFCHPRTTIIWANKVRMVTDIEFTEKFKKEFNTKLLAEDGDMKIFMGKFKM